MSTRHETWFVVAGLLCTALVVWVIGPVVATLSDTMQALGGVVVFVGIIWAIGWGTRLSVRAKPPSPK